MKAYIQGLTDKSVFDTTRNISIKFRPMKHIQWFIMYDEMLKTTMFGVRKYIFRYLCDISFISSLIHNIYIFTTTQNIIR